MFGLGVVLISIGVLIFLTAISCEIEEKHPASIIGFLGGMFFVSGIVLVNMDGNPTALNVYQGKTTLEITYKDSIAIDSVVVFKK